MNSQFLWLGSIVALMPLSVEIPPDSSTGYPGVTRVRVAGGGGAYAFIARGCEGQVIDKVPVRFEDIGGSLEHRIGTGPLTFGVRGGRIRHRVGMPEDSLHFGPGVPIGRVVDNSYVNPFLSIDEEAHGAGLGWVITDGEFITAGEGAREQADHPLNEVSAHLRVGRLHSKHFIVQWMEGVPLASSGGYLTALAGGPLVDPRWTLRGGLGAGGPYEGAGLLLRLEYAGAGPLAIDVGTRLGILGGDGHWGAAVGIAYAVGR